MIPGGGGAGCGGGGDGDGDGDSNGDGGGSGDGVPTTLPIWPGPQPITPRDQISHSGIPHFDMLKELFWKSRALLR